MGLIVGDRFCLEIDTKQAGNYCLQAFQHRQRSLVFSEYKILRREVLHDFLQICGAASSYLFIMLQLDIGNRGQSNSTTTESSYATVL
jgi:hypothetical protein